MAVTGRHSPYRNLPLKDVRNPSCVAMFSNAKARADVWNFPDPIPLHHEALFSPRPDLIDKYPTHDDKKSFWRVPTLFKSVQQKNRDVGKQFPLMGIKGK